MATEYFAGDPRTNRERMLAGDYYIADDAESNAIAAEALRLTAQYYHAEANGLPDARGYLVRLLGSIGDDSYIKPPLHVDYGENIHIGDGVFINSDFTALDVARIDIGDHCQIGPKVQLLTPTHPIAPIPRRDKLEAAEPIVLEQNVWLGGGVVVCPGVRIGKNTVVGAGAVVTKDLPPNAVAVGNPARVIREIDENETI